MFGVITLGSPVSYWASHYVDAEGRSLYFGVITTWACQVTDQTPFCALTDKAVESCV